MSKGKFEQKGRHCRRRFGSKSTALVLALVLLVGGVIGGTVAWLTDKTESVQNTFSTSDITITLQGHTYDATEHKLTDQTTETGVTNYKMVPGWTIPKDPWVTVQANSEDCYLFIKVEEANNFDNFMSYAIDTAWKELPNVDGVYYMEVTGVTENKTFAILGAGSGKWDNVDYSWSANQVLTNPNVTNEMMDAATSAPGLSFTAYAVQLYKSQGVKFEVADAWNMAKGLSN